MLEPHHPNIIDLSIFENNNNSEFVIAVRRNKTKSTQALNQFIFGLKTGAADTRETSRIIYKFVAKQELTKEDELHIKTQVYDVFKMLGIGIPFMFIPGATLLIPFLLKAAEKKGIDLIPSNFRSNGKNRTKNE